MRDEEHQQLRVRALDGGDAFVAHLRTTGFAEYSLQLIRGVEIENDSERGRARGWLAGEGYTPDV